jgi:ATP-dependent Lhr-like helicase
VLSSLPQTSLFSARFRECAARRCCSRGAVRTAGTPLWQQRQRAADLLAVASKYPSFPILLETSARVRAGRVRSAGAARGARQLRSRAIRVVSVDTQKASPFAQSLLFNWIAAYMYEGDAPLAERRAAALALDRDLLRDLLGAEELRELLDPGVLADLELELSASPKAVARAAPTSCTTCSQGRRPVAGRDRPACETVVASTGSERGERGSGSGQAQLLNDAASSR